MVLFSESFSINVNSFGVLSSMVTIVFFLTILVLYAIIFERTKTIRYIITFDLLMLLYLIAFLLLVNASTEKEVYVYTKLYYTFLALHTAVYFNIIGSSSKFKTTLIRVYSLGIGLLYLILLWFTDYIFINEVSGVSFYHLELGSLYNAGSVAMMTMFLIAAYDFISRIVKKDQKLKELWPFYTAYCFHAVILFIIGRLIQKGLINNPPLYINIIAINVMFLIYVFLKMNKEVTARNQMYKALMYDHLTGVYTREYIIEKLTSYLGGDRKTALFVAMIDLDQFKVINDRYSHMIGDEILSGLGVLLHQEENGLIVPGRIGGDEFIVLFNQVSKKEVVSYFTTLENAYKQLMIEKEVDYKEIHAGISVGITQVDSESTLEQVLGQADSAMYKSKKHLNKPLTFY